MDWAALKSNRVRAAYNAETRDLHVKFPGSQPVKHLDIPQHVYQNLLETDDPHFYYRYYIAPSRVPESRRRVFSAVSYGLKLAFLLIACSLFMANDLDPGQDGSFEASALRQH
ncbi:KTSC domain-containing protein [Rhizobium vallis]|uniref:KTSC domain-containing protein n=1 Tax=Rhizobium vallis TaxID=634290 RepID=A0A3S0RA46_9HYPH|nr:KTSC domain-containing protein [Rhizobium vallis]RUM25161.1 KTSC domain-containing protein [Rhizobium vallis]